MGVDYLSLRKAWAVNFKGSIKNQYYVDFEQPAEVYLSRLASHSSQFTYYSHYGSITGFLQSQEAQTTGALLPSLCIARYLESQSHSELAASTVRGCLACLSNFLAFLLDQSPAICKRYLLAADCSLEHASLCPLHDRDQYPTLTDAERTSISAFVDRVRRRRYGSRLHTFIALCIDTCAQPTQIHDLDLSDLDMERGRIRVGIPETYVVSTSGLLPTRTATLDDSTLEILKEYLNYERVTPKSETDGLLTTYAGRASMSTIRRDFRTATVPHEPTDTPKPSGQTATPPTPRDIWRYALATLL